MLSNKLFFLAGLCLLLLYFLISHRGFGSTVDAEAYLFAAKSLKNEFSLLSPFGYYTNWTPLFPFLIALFGLHFVQYTAFLLNIILLYQVGAVFLSKNSLYYFLFFLHSSFSVVFLMIHFFVWSEAWFLVFLLSLLCICLHQLAKRQLSAKALVLMIMLANLLCLQRMAGVFFVLAFTLLIALYFSKKQAFLFGILSSIGIMAWFLRNSFLQSKPDFLDNIFMVSWQESLSGYSKAFFNNFLPSYWLPDILAIALLFVAVCVLVFLLFQEKKNASLAWLSLYYLMAMFVLRMNVAGESERYLAPIQPLVLLIFWHKVEKWSKINLGRKLLYVSLFLMMTFQTLRTVKNVKQWCQTPPNLIDSKN
mgnify:CR=1 FL=1